MKHIKLLCSLALGLAAGATNAATITVDDDGTADYTTIEAAVNASQPGDTVFIMPGTFQLAETITPPSDYVVIKGSGMDQTVILNPPIFPLQPRYTINLEQRTGVVIEDLHLSAVEVSVAGLVMIGCRDIRVTKVRVNMFDIGIAAGHPDNEGISVEHSEFRGVYRRSGVGIATSAKGLTLIGNLIENYGVGIRVTYYTTPSEPVRIFGNHIRVGGVRRWLWPC